jgi:hypothetical protein
MVQHIRKILELPNWGENPFRNAHVSYRSDAPGELYLVFAPAVEWLYEFAKSCQFPEPERTSKGIHAWWTTHFPLMTPEQQRALWNWFDPEPFFITEIELEGDLG